MAKTRKAASPERRMQQLTAKAFDLAEKQLEDKTISPSTLNVLLKAGTVEQELLLENMRSRNKLNSSKVDMLEVGMKEKGDSQTVIDALRGYAPSMELGDEYEDEDEDY